MLHHTEKKKNLWTLLCPSRRHLFSPQPNYSLVYSRAVILFNFDMFWEWDSDGKRTMQKMLQHRTDDKVEKVTDKNGKHLQMWPEVLQKCQRAINLMSVLAQGLFDNLQIKHGLADCITCKYSLPGCLPHFAAETLTRVFVGCGQACGVAPPSASEGTRQPSLSRCFKNRCRFLHLSCFPPLLWGQRIPDCLRPRMSRNRGVQQSSQESSDLSSEGDINHCHYKLVRLRACWLPQRSLSKAEQHSWLRPCWWICP